MYTTNRTETQSTPITTCKTFKVENGSLEPQELNGMIQTMRSDGVGLGDPFEKVYKLKGESEKPATTAPDRRYYFPELWEHLDKRVVEARIDAMENRYDRELLKTQETIDAQKLVMELLLERIKDIEQDIPSLRKGYYKPRFALSEPVKMFSSQYVQEKATQTPSEKHSVEGVYVSVSRSNGARVQRVKKTALPRVYHYGYPEITEFYDNGKITRTSDTPLLTRAHLRTSSMPTKSVEFFPPIPGWNEKRRPRKP